MNESLHWWHCYRTIFTICWDKWERILVGLAIVNSSGHVEMTESVLCMSLLKFILNATLRWIRAYPVCYCYRSFFTICWDKWERTLGGNAVDAVRLLELHHDPLTSSICAGPRTYNTCIANSLSTTLPTWYNKSTNLL